MRVEKEDWNGGIKSYGDQGNIDTMVSMVFSEGLVGTDLMEMRQERIRAALAVSERPEVVFALSSAFMENAHALDQNLGEGEDFHQRVVSEALWEHYRMSSEQEQQEFFNLLANYNLFDPYEMSGLNSMTHGQGFTNLYNIWQMEQEGLRQVQLSEKELEIIHLIEKSPRQACDQLYNDQTLDTELLEQYLVYSLRHSDIVDGSLDALAGKITEMDDSLYDVVSKLAIALQHVNVAELDTHSQEALDAFYLRLAE